MGPQDDQLVAHAEEVLAEARQLCWRAEQLIQDARAQVRISRRLWARDEEALAVLRAMRDGPP